MAAKSGVDIVSEFLSQNPHLVKWVDSLKEYCETGHQWLARREFILRNLELFPTIQPGTSSHNLDRLLSLSMVWANMVFLGCRYPHPVMSKINEMAEGIVVTDVLERKTRDELMGKTKRPADSALHSDLQQKKTKPNESDVKAHARSVVHPAVSPKINLPPGAPAEHQAFFNRLYKTVAWKLVSAGGFGPNLEHFEILRSCVESNKSTLSCVFVPLKDIPDLPSGRTQKEGQVCELRCHTVYMGTGYGRDDFSAKAMASKEALKVFQGQKVTVKICRRRFRGRDVDDLVLLDEQSRSQAFPPALSHPFQEGQ